MKNIFFDKSKLRGCGTNVIIGKTVRIRYPEFVEIGDNVIIDDFTYISTSLKLHSNTHISSGCKIIGGKNAFVEMFPFSTLAPNVVLSAGSDDYTDGIATPMVPSKFKASAVIGRIIINKHCIVGANSVVLPNVIFNEGSTLGALSLANKDLEEYKVYAGIPAKLIKARNKVNILNLEQELWDENKIH
jgi:acetyltransferase-like isoleucine patch superfamily enzyme